MVDIIDLHFQGTDQAIAAFLIDTSAGAVLVECGPHTTLPRLEAALAERGRSLGDIRHLLLTHIHFDHAGAAWALAEAGATVHVHPVGAPHLGSPEKLVNSARRIYQEQMDTLWGDIRPIADDRLKAADDRSELTVGGTTFVAHHTPGHASHHIAWQMGDVLFTGDVAGVKIGSGTVVPPCPPPDIDIDAWEASMDRIREIAPDTLYLTHFGAVTDIESHLEELTSELHVWSGWVRERWAEGKRPEEVTDAFMAFTNERLMANGTHTDDLARYEAANPAWMSVAGLMRYWKKREG